MPCFKYGDFEYVVCCESVEAVTICGDQYCLHLAHQGGWMLIVIVVGRYHSPESVPSVCVLNWNTSNTGYFCGNGNGRVSRFQVKPFEFGAPTIQTQLS